MSSALRGLKRNRAKANLKQIGQVKICKHQYSGAGHQITRLASSFSDNWRKMSGGVVAKTKKKEEKKK